MEQMWPTTIREKSYLRSVGVIMDMIAEGKLQYGDRLYKEHELAEMLGVSRPTMREALRVLEFLGVASAVPHRGISINEPSAVGGYLPLLYILSFEKTTGKELFQLREAMQLEMVAYAAVERTEEDLRELKALVAQMEKEKGAPAEVFSQLDDKFHQKLLEVSGNRLVYKLMETIRPMLQSQLTDRIEKLPMKERNGTIAAHTKILDAIEKGDGLGARQAMYDHLAGSRQYAGDQLIKFKK